MTLDMIKNRIDSKLGEEVNVICNCARNKKEYYSGVISETYSYIFIVRLNTNENKCFCYSDVLTNNVELFFKQNM